MADVVGRVGSLYIKVRSDSYTHTDILCMHAKNSLVSIYFLEVVHVQSQFHIFDSVE